METPRLADLVKKIGVRSGCPLCDSAPPDLLDEINEALHLVMSDEYRAGINTVFKLSRERGLKSSKETFYKHARECLKGAG